MQQLVPTLLSFLTLAEDLESFASYVNDYHNASECCPTCSDLSRGDNSVAYFNQKLINWGYDSVVFRADSAAKPQHWCDSNTHANHSACTDHTGTYGVDTQDVVLHYGHGSTNGNSSQMVFDNTDGTGECYFRYGENSNTTLWGDDGNQGLHVVIIDTCHSLQRELLDSEGVPQVNAPQEPLEDFF